MILVYDPLLCCRGEVPGSASDLGGAEAVGPQKKGSVRCELNHGNIWLMIYIYNIDIEIQRYNIDIEIYLTLGYIYIYMEIYLYI